MRSARPFGRVFAGLVLALSLDAGAQITFSAATPYSTGPKPLLVRAADLNGDGRLDLVVLNQGDAGGQGSISVLLASGAPGSFAPAVTYPAGGSQPTGITAADFNGDGKPDVATGNTGSGDITILLNDGSGGFPTATTGFAGGAGGIVAANFNGGGIDLAVARRPASTVSILSGNGDGTFTAGATLPGTPPNVMVSVVAGDFNGDGKMDLAAADNGSVHIYLGAGDGTFAAAGSYPGAIALAVGDFNGDGRLDIAVGGAATIAILLGNGDGTFTPGTTVPTGGFATVEIITGDVDRDGKLDLVVANAGLLSNNFTVLAGHGDGTFAAPILFVQGRDVRGVALADLDGDGRLDAMSTSNFTDQVFVRLNTTPVTPNPPTSVVATPGNGQVSVAFVPPSDAASLPIIDFTVTCGGISATGSGSPVVVGGLVNGVSFTCTVTARNATGAGRPSAPSNAVTLGPPETHPVPTLSEWALILLALLTAAIGARHVKAPASRRASSSRR